MIDKLHRIGNGAVPRDIGDRPVHRLTDSAVGRVSLRRGPQLDDVHRFARVHLHEKANAVGHHHAVERDVAEALAREPLVKRGRSIHDVAPVGRGTGVDDGRRFDKAVAGAERLPVNR